MCKRDQYLRVDIEVKVVSLETFDLIESNSKEESKQSEQIKELEDERKNLQKAIRKFVQEEVLKSIMKQTTVLFSLKTYFNRFNYL